LDSPWAVHVPDLHGRQTWDEYFLTIAAAAATRSNCARRRVGAVLVAGRHIRSTGYNGPPSGYGHCDEGACPRSDSALPAGGDPDYSNCVAIHAEANALLFAAPEQRARATLYTTQAPCFQCAKLIANSGVAEVVAGGGRYDGWDATRRFLQDCGVRVRVIETSAAGVSLPL
jgi:dCMP deaminase